MILQTSARMVATSPVAGAIEFDEDEAWILAHVEARDAQFRARTIRD